MVILHFASTKNYVHNEDFTTFYQTTALLLQNDHFSLIVIKFALGSIPKFDTIIEKRKKRMDQIPSSLKWVSHTCLLL